MLKVCFIDSLLFFSCISLVPLKAKTFLKSIETSTVSFTPAYLLYILLHSLFSPMWSTCFLFTGDTQIIPLAVSSVSF